MDYQEKLRNCRTIADVFELVKEVVYYYLGQEQSGLLVGLSDLGKFPNGFIGAFYTPNNNMIIINNQVLTDVRTKRPELYKPYLFHLLLHEYIHSLGYYDEIHTREITKEISRKFGDVQVYQMATDMAKFFPEIILGQFQPPKNINIDFVPGIDRKNTNYIN